MLLRQRLFRSAPALAFLILNIFLALSLYGYDPADAVGWRAAEAPEGSEPVAPANPCGPVGASLANASQQLFGRASWLVLLAMVAVNLLIVRRRRVSDRVGAGLGFALVVAVASALAFTGPCRVRVPRLSSRVSVSPAASTIRLPGASILPAG